jgi:AraC family transcriptional regulator of adaptative response / DNA-3-methyladenine glycosylase II
MHHLLDNATCERARLARDARFDGVFFTGVRSTGIYCRPVCPAPAPKPQNVSYYPSAAAAANAGYRPCLRCRPELAPEAALQLQDESLRRTLALMDEGWLLTGASQALAKEIGLSSRQLQRLFVDRLGATPKQIHANRRLLLAKQLLTETRMPITQIALAAGFNSIRRFNSAFSQGCQMTPGALRRSQSGGSDAQICLRLAYRPPLDFPALLTFLRRRAIPGIEQIGQQHYSRVIGGTTPCMIEVRARDDRPELELRIDASIAPATIPEIVRKVRRLFDMDADLSFVHAVLGEDPLLAPGLARRPGLRVPGAWDGFELAVRAVLGQQVSVVAATTLAARLTKRFGQPLSDMPAGLDHLFPSAHTLQDAALEEIGLPRTRAATIRSLARACVEQRLDFSSSQDLSRFVQRCTALPGIGAWTAHYIALRALGLPDAFPAGDLVLQKVMGHPGRLSEKAAEAHSQSWRPWRAYAVLHLWHLSAESAKDLPS